MPLAWRGDSEDGVNNNGTLFTGTGNSRYLAGRIANALNMPLYDLNACIKAGDTAPELQNVIVHIEVGQEFAAPRNNLYDRFLSGPVNPIFYRFFVKADPFTAGDACIGCGKCVTVCPLNNIHLEQGKPVWGDQCTHCMACICYCPKEAIEYGKKSAGKPRYHFQELGL